MIMLLNDNKGLINDHVKNVVVSHYMILSPVFSLVKMAATRFRSNKTNRVSIVATKNIHVNKKCTVDDARHRQSSGLG